MEIVALNARDALIKCARMAVTYGRERTPRGLKTRDLAAVTVRVQNPADWHCAGIGANWSAKVAAVEALQLIGGFSAPELVKKFAPSLMAFTNEEGRFDGAYGLRAGGVLESVVGRLERDPDTRQAIVPIYAREDALRPASKDYPCTLSIGFDVEDGRLNCHVTMRSNDVDWGSKHDFSQFMLLQCSVANVLGLSVGEYTHHAYSLHLYERSFGWAREIGGDVATLSSTIPLGGLAGDDADQLGQRARAIAFGYGGRHWWNGGPWNGGPFNPVETWLRETLYGTN